MKTEIILNENKIKSKIYTVRGLQVMIDRDLAELYNVETRALNQAVKRNIERFPGNFMFQLDGKDYKNLASQNVTSSAGWGGRRNLNIMNAFVSMRKFIASNAQIFQRLDNVEKKQIEYDKKFEQVFSAIEDKDIKPEKGIFFDGQIFDSYKFVSDLIRSADKSIDLIDNYVDDSVLALFIKRNSGVSVTIFTKEITKQLSLDIVKYNSQYPSVSIKKFNYSHDRFLIIDENEVYHFGASLKDLGKKWFAFSKFDKEAFKLLDRLKECVK